MSMTDTWSVEGTEAGVAIKGEIDWENAPQIAKTLYEAAKDVEGSFTIDMSGVTFMDSSGISALTRVIDVCPAANIVIESSRHAFAMLELAGMTRGDWPNVVVLPPNDDADPAVN
jgi:anti-anti-sigma factor